MKNLYVLLLCLLPCMGIGQTKNTSTEVIDYREVDGKIIVGMVVNGVSADFVLDLAGHTAILSEYVEKLQVDPDVPAESRYSGFQYKKVKTGKTVKIGSISFGNSVFVGDETAFLLEDESYLRELGVAGVIGGSFFANTVLTIDAQRKKITISAPYRPSYMKLNYRTDVSLVAANGVVCPVVLNGQTWNLLLDTWNDATIVLSEEDFAKLEAKTGEASTISVGYGKNTTPASVKEVENAIFVKSDLGTVPVFEDKTLPRSILGRGILKHGLLSIDYVRHKIYFQPFDLVEVKDEVEEIPEVKIEAGKLNPITREYFLEHIYDYRKSKEFVYKGDKPVVIDFWATWCGPCMRLLPEMEKLAEKYKDQVIFLKVNADKEKELCNIFNIVALPTVFFIPVGGKPIIETGALPEKYMQIIEEQLLKK